MKELTRRHFISSLLAAAGTAGLQVPLIGQAIKEADTTDAPELNYDLINLFDYEELAKYKIQKPVYEYIVGGAADEITLGWNRSAYDQLKLLPRVLTDVSTIDCSTHLFGRKLAHPILLAPTALHRAVHPEGEIATVQGSNKASSLFVLSTGATVTVEDAAREASGPLWFQLYVLADQQFNRDLVSRVEEAGCKALVITVDSPSDGARNREARSRFAEFVKGMNKPNLAGFKGRPRTVPGIVKPLKLTWSDIEDLKGHTGLPVIVKGILNPLDAEEAVKRGLDGIVVSNHGARVLDTVPATIEVLPRILEKIDGRIPVLVDGGIRRGTDVLKAMAYGASAVLIGRPYLYGLGVGGAEGVAHVVDILVHELRMAMALTGRPNMASLDRTVFWQG